MTDYTHPDHGEMIERTITTPGRGEHNVLMCERCRVLAPVDEDLDSVFDEHECDRYERLGKKISGAI